MSFISIDWESDGPYPPDYSGVCFGAVIVKPGLEETFYGKVKPISEQWNPDVLKISGISREEHLTFPEPKETMEAFAEWVIKNSKGRPVFISDNPAYDWMFNHYYLLKFTGKDPFGWSGRRIGDLWCGMQKDTHAKWKFMREIKHDHNPLNDAKANASVLLKMKELGLKIDLR